MINDIQLSHNTSDKDEKSLHNSSHEKNTYAILMETNGDECESWLYFIKYQGNKENLEHLNSQLEQVDWFIMDDLSTFDLEIKYLVSEQTAKEMTKVDLNHKSFNRKFDGTLKKINLGFKKKDKNEKKIIRSFNVLGYGKIDKFIDEEDIDEEDLITNSSESSSESESESVNLSEDEKSEKKKKKLKKIPNSLKNSVIKTHVSTKE